MKVYHPCSSSLVGYAGIYTCIAVMTENLHNGAHEQFKKALANPNKHVFSPSDITYLIVQARAEYPFPRSLSERKFQKSLIDSGVLKEISLSLSVPSGCWLLLAECRTASISSSASSRTRPQF